MLKVLIVDDDAIQLRTRAMILGGAGLTVSFAADVESALATLRSMDEQIGVVVTDHNLPGRSGVELVCELRRTKPSLPVVVVTGMPGVEPEYEGLNVTICYKPVPPAEFVRIIKSALEQ